MTIPLWQLPTGSRFRQPQLNVTGTLLMVNECRAHVRIDVPARRVRIPGKTEFVADKGRTDNWAPCVEVELLKGDCDE